MSYAIARLILVPIGFALAAVVTALVLVKVGGDKVIQGFGGTTPRGLPEVGIGAAWELMRLTRSLLRIETLIPPLLLVIAGEVAKIRSVAYYAVGGGMALASVPLLAKVGIMSGNPNLDPRVATQIPIVVYQVFATAGIAGGFVYWWLAGKRV